MENISSSAETAPVHNGRFALHQAVRVMLHAELYYAGQSKGWVPVADYGTGHIMPLPDDSDRYEGMVNFMPDEPLPIGCHFATRHPIVMNFEPFFQTKADGSTERLRTVIIPV